MQTHELKPNTKRKKAQLRGRGGKRGKTSGRGGKGQTARAGNKRRPEMRDLIKKLPRMRGRGKNSNKTIDFGRVFPISLGMIEISYKAGEVVSIQTLLSKGLIAISGGKRPFVKILSQGDLTKKVTVENLPVSKEAQAKIEKAGGAVLPAPVEKK